MRLIEVDIPKRGSGTGFHFWVGPFGLHLFSPFDSRPGTWFQTDYCRRWRESA